MLKPVTKRYADDSSMSRFVFEFYCDCCGHALPPVVILPRIRFKKKPRLSPEEREARTILYAHDHTLAYERANNEIRHELNRCEICADLVCEECTVYGALDSGGICCRRCAESR